MADGAEGLAEAVRRGRAGGHDVKAGALGVVLDGDLAGSDVGDHRGDEQRGNPLAGGVVEEFEGLLVLGLETADTGADIDAEAERIDILLLAVGVEAGVVHRLPGSGDAEEGEAVLLADKGLVHAELLAVEFLDLGGNLDGEFLRRITGDEIDAANAIQQVVPVGGNVLTDGGDDTQTGNDNAFSFFHSIYRT